MAEEVLERLRGLAVLAGGADARVEREQAALEVAVARAEVPADRGLAADLVVGHVPGAGGERRDVLLEGEEDVDGRRRAERDGVAVDRNAVEAGV